MLEALEAGTSGVVLKTEDPLQVCHLTPQPGYTRSSPSCVSVNGTAQYQMPEGVEVCLVVMQQ